MSVSYYTQCVVQVFFLSRHHSFLFHGNSRD